MRKIGLMLLCSLFFAVVGFAQQAVKGKVVDQNGSPVTKATVSSGKNTVPTDAQGEFTINAKIGDNLRVTYVGYEAANVKVAETMTIALTPRVSEEKEVIVTAQGIRREKKALGYAVTTVDKRLLELRPDGDVVRILNGKAPGVDILNTSGISGSGTNITIRGVNTISGSSTPLFVVDGVPFDASTNSQADFTRGNTASSRFLDIDPNNIENVSVLKGLSATTLYGELGRNGVVLITTKNAATRNTKKKAEITVTQSLFVNKVANLPEYQYTYGGGFDQSVGLQFFSNWGAKFTDPPATVQHPYDRPDWNLAFPQFVGKQYEFKPYKNSVKNFFRTGQVSTTSINIASGGPNGSFSANYTYLEDKGFTPGNTLRKNTFGIGGTTKLTNKFSLSASNNFAITDFITPPTSTSFGSNPTTSSVFGNLIYTPIAIDLNGLPWENPLDKSSVYYRGGNDIQNPYWTVNNSFNKQKVNRVYGNLQLKYDILANLNLSYRVGYDVYSDNNSFSQNRGGTVGGDDYTLGMHRTVDGTNEIWDHSFLVNWNTKYKDWSFNTNAGINSQERIYKQNGQRSTNQLVYGLFDHDNFINHDNLSESGDRLDFKSQTQSIGVFAQVESGYKDYLYVTLGGRNSTSSNLEKANRSIFYPSASVSFIPTSLFPELVGNKITYLKLRAGYSTSANFGTPYNTRPILNISTNVFQDRVGTVINTNSIGNQLANPDLRPELLKETEFGVEGRFWDGRITLDATYYNRTSKNQILSRDLDPSSGYTSTFINAGSLRNKGWEIAFGVTPIRSRNWKLTFDVNYTRNRNLVFDLPDEVKSIVIAGFTGEGLFAINNQPLGIIQGSYAIRDASKGNQRVVNSQGNYILSSEIGVLGDPNAKYRLNAMTSLGYKNFNFRMQWDYKKGGDMIAYTPGTLVGRGLTKDTEFDRLLPFILPGVKQDGTPNDIQISTSQAYFNNFSGQFGHSDLVLYDATMIRLREASLSYNLPEKLLKNMPFGSVSFVLSGQNLWYLAPNFPKYTNFDPEVSSTGVGNVNGLEYLAGPTSKRFGASIRVTF